MDFTPLYSLRDRLKVGAVAGTNLIGEDFRLTRAIEAFAPLESVSPVFAKIGQGARALAAPDCPDRAGALLELLALVDAVLTTQSTVAVSADITPIKLTAKGSLVTNAPYSLLSPLMDALQNSGGGRYSLVMETHERSPELFADYRVRNALVEALGASYSDLAAKAEEWLSREDESVLPLLMRGFDPKGKRDMVRRIHVMEAVSGAGCNEFYRSLLDEAEKEVRCAAIYALRHTEENAGLLCTLAKTEKGNAKKQAHWALSRLESPEAWAYWDGLAAKKPEQAADYMALSTARQASRLVAGSLLEILRPFEEKRGEMNRELADRMQRLLHALPGKSGPQVCDFFRKAARLGTAFNLVLPGEKAMLHFTAGAGYYSGGGQIFSEVLPMVLFRCLLLNPAQDLLALAGELQRTGPFWEVPGVAAALLSRPAGEAWAAGKHLVQNAFGLLRKKEYREALNELLGSVRWDDSAQRQVLQAAFENPAAENTFYQTQPLAQPMDLGWYEALAKGKASQDDLLIRLVQPQNPQVRQFLAPYLYNQALANPNNVKYMQPLVALGWPKCEGLGVRYCEGQKKLSSWQIESLFEKMPGTNAAKAQEAQRVLHLAEAGKIALSAGRELDALRQMVLAFQNAHPNGR